MPEFINKMIQGYQDFRKIYASGDNSIMRYLSYHGQKPEALFVACCDSRVDPALILQCDPGDLFVVRNVANIVPPYEKDKAHHGTSAALEFGICYLKIPYLILLGHSQCGGIQALLNSEDLKQDDFISDWVSLIQTSHPAHQEQDVDGCAKESLHQSYQNCLSFPWIKERVENQSLKIYLWFFDIEKGQIFTYDKTKNDFVPL